MHASVAAAPWFGRLFWPPPCKLWHVEDAVGSPHPMAAQLARLLTRSDVDELEEVVRRWLAAAPTAQHRKQFEQFGAKLIEMKQALAEAPYHPTEEELTITLTMMLNLAAQRPDSPFRTP